MRHLSCPVYMPEGNISNLTLLSPSLLILTTHEVDEIFIPILQRQKLDPRQVE